MTSWLLDERVRLTDVAHLALQLSRSTPGITAAEVDVSVGRGYRVGVRGGDVETLERAEDKAVSLTVYRGLQSGSVSFSDFSPAAIVQAVEKANFIATMIEPDPCNGLADPELLARSYEDLDLYHPWDLPVREAILQMIACERKALASDQRIKCVEEAGLSTREHIRLYANTDDFIGIIPSTMHQIACSLVAESSNGMERDGDYTCARDAKQLASLDWVAAASVEKTVQRLDAKSIPPQRCPVLLDSAVAKGLLKHAIQLITGPSLYRRQSCLMDAMGEQIFPEWLTLYQDPHERGGYGSAPFDNQGVRTVRQAFVENGILTRFVLGAYAARKLGLTTTGNAGGVYNLSIEAPLTPFTALLKKMDRGLLVTEMMGQGVNLLTGDYSRGAAGYWVENGEIQYPVHEITLAGNLRDMFLHTVALGDDVDRRTNVRVGSWLLESMIVAGEGQQP